MDTCSHPIRCCYSRNSLIIPPDVTRKPNKTCAPSERQCIVDTVAQCIRRIQLSTEPIPFDNWCSKRVDASPQFQNWFMVMQLELLIFVHVRSLRNSNFALNVTTLTALAPLFLTLGHIHYSRWVPIHIRDMMTLQERHPNIESQFAQGGFVVHKTKRPFSATAIDHAHEQNNKVMKADGGAVGLIQKPRVNQHRK